MREQKKKHNTKYKLPVGAFFTANIIYLVATLWTTPFPLCSFSLFCSSSLCLLSAKYSKIFHDILRYFKIFRGTSKYFSQQDIPDRGSEETIHHHHHLLPPSTLSDRKNGPILSIPFHLLSLSVQKAHLAFFCSRVSPPAGP